MLDDALLRPGRLEVQVEVGLPDEVGRAAILKIHTSRMAANSFLGRDVDLAALAARTKNFSGAELEGLVKSAASFALNRQVDVTDLTKQLDESLLKVGAPDFEAALAEVVPAFGASTAELQAYVAGGILDSGDAWRHLRSTLKALVEQARHSDATPLLTCLMEGYAGAGKTATAASVGLECGFPLVRLVSPDAVVGHGEVAKAAALAKAFDDAYKSPLSLIILDDVERLLEYVAIGPRFSNVVLQARDAGLRGCVQGSVGAGRLCVRGRGSCVSAMWLAEGAPSRPCRPLRPSCSPRTHQTLLVLLKKPPPPGRRLLVVGTTSVPAVMDDLGVAGTFQAGEEGVREAGAARGQGVWAGQDPGALAATPPVATPNSPLPATQQP